ncbi:MAG: hypothetical protein ACTSYM_14070 [Candidatus Baldrarchaeia archaeon]
MDVAFLYNNEIVMVECKRSPFKSFEQLTEYALYGNFIYEAVPYTVENENEIRYFLENELEQAILFKNLRDLMQNKIRWTKKSRVERERRITSLVRVLQSSEGRELVEILAASLVCDTGRALVSIGGASLRTSYMQDPLARFMDRH